MDTVQTRAFKNSLIGVLTYMIGLIQSIITVPIFLSEWSSEEYGIWITLLAGFSLLQIFDIGHHNYVGNKINVIYHSNKYEVKEILGSSLLISVLLGVAQVLITLVIINTNLITLFLGLNTYQINNYKVEWALFILIFSWFLVGSYGGILHRLLIPVGFLSQSQWWNFVYRFSQFVITVLVLLFNGSLLSLCFFYSFVQIVVFIFTFVYIKKKIPLFYPWWAVRSWNIAIDNFKKSIILTMNNIVQQLSNNGLILFVTNMFSSNIVPCFTTLKTMTNAGVGITNIVILSLLPDISRYHAKNEFDKIIHTQYGNWFVSGIIVNISITILLPFASIIYHIWTKDQLLFDFGLFLFLMSSISIINFGSGLLLCLTAINDLKSQTMISLVRLASLFSALIIFSKNMNLSDIGMAVMISEILCSIILPLILVNKYLNKLQYKMKNIFIYTALFPPFILCSISLLFYSHFAIDIYYSSLLGLLINLLIYTFNWRKLPIEIKTRIKEVINIKRMIYNFE